MKTKILFLALLLGLSTQVSASPIFNSGIPSSWICTGNCGTGVADGDVTLAPGSTTPYGWVSTDGGVNGVNLPGIDSSATDGSMLRTGVFSATAGEDLEFDFNYITSDGAGFADYAWARLLDDALNEIAILFTARTKSSGTIVPGDGMPAPAATLTPASVPIIGGAPDWSPLGSSSGSCYSSGCGYTDWVHSSYTIAAAGNYVLEFGTTNWLDTAYDSGMAFDGILVGGDPIVPDPIPEPASFALLGLGLIGMGAVRRRRK